MKILSKINYKSIFKIGLLFVFMIILSNASIVGVIHPFAYAFAFALVFNGVYPILACAMFGLTSICFNFAFTNIVSSLLVVAMLVLMLIVQKVSKKNKLYLLILFAVFSRIANVYFSLTNVSSLIWALVDLCVGVLYLLIFSRLVDKIKNNSIQMLSNLERTFFYLSVIAVFAGISNIYIYEFNVSKLIIILLTLIGTCIFENKSILLALSASAGICMQTFAIDMVPIIFVATSVMLFFKQNKFLSVGIISLLDAVIVLVSKINYINILPTIIALVLFVCIPQKLLKTANLYIFGANKPILMPYLAEKNRNDLKNRLLSIGLMFSEMQNCYKSLIVNNFDEQSKIDYIATNIKNKICSSCINYMQCYDGKDMLFEIKKLIETSIVKEKANILDVSNALATNCVKLNLCISQVNNIVQEYKNELSQINQDKENKLAVSVQLSGTEQLFKNLSSQFTAKKKINENKSNQIKNLFAKHEILCKECLAVEDFNGVSEIYLVVKNSDAANALLSQVCSKIYRQSFEKDSCELTKYAGWSLIKFVPMNKFEIQCGVALKPKEVGDESGDNYVFTKLNNGKYLIAICDGMGHGKEANKISLAAINLMQSLYNCGLSSSVIMDSINSLIVPANKGFTTIDATIVDTNTGEVDFIKLGSTISAVKKQETTEIVDVESLPVGVSEIIKPTYTVKKLLSGDAVVLVSDGVVDVFGEKTFKDYVNNERTYNMQTFADNLLNEAASRKILHKDDMTVIAYKLIAKNW